MQGTDYLVTAKSGSISERFKAKAKALRYAKELSRGALRVSVYLDNPRTGFHLFVARYSDGKAERGAGALVKRPGD